MKVQEKNPTIGSELTKACDILATTIEDLQTFIYDCEKTEEPKKDDSSKLAAEIEKVDSHLDAFKRLVQKKDKPVTRFLSTAFELASETLGCLQLGFGVVGLKGFLGKGFPKGASFQQETPLKYNAGRSCVYH